ncbi:DeoR family transcriptional regulator [Defluviimonas sp. 20V17]|uniref:DeoR family transcriptional regulator n=1 Tax=Allgaiera indica TaxID=765699 RepID=A0AAN4UQ87_9RHOB|nr:DeoR/GlpR family DNA-binding transcription regulator [Allgaiera indica]KDB03071.1 DeoR family transcriptional regulator [Defluviimonas sp. 20V17]GHE00834.1 DeoR family transcriptional regulator [Allgaiera indica]SDW72768.1 transcriptional regulator, DeoR family [Allgaiera indica]
MQKTKGNATRLRKSERREQIVSELRLHPHVRVGDLAERFGVSTETVRRDFEALERKGLVTRALGGASAPSPGTAPSLDERGRARSRERERIGARAAALVQPGETLMIDSGATTLQVARFLSFAGTRCTAITNSLHVAMTLGHNGAAKVILCPGTYLPTEAAVVGAETVDFLRRYRVRRCFVGASALLPQGPMETVEGYAAVKRAMLDQSEGRHLVIDSDKFGRSGFAHLGTLDLFDSIITDSAPPEDLAQALASAGVEISMAD